MFQVDETLFKDVLTDSLRDVLAEYYEEFTKPQYLTVKKFTEHVGMDSDSWFRTHIMSHPDFKPAVYQADRKIYIRVAEGERLLDVVMAKIKK